MDEVDLKILHEFCNLNGKETSTWELMKKVYPDGRDSQHNIIKRKIEKMEKQGLFFINQNSKKHYQLISDNVKSRKMKFPDNKMHNSISIKICGKWQSFQL